ncbi:MAG: carboxypeptidase regulatory-like domain-containing protein [Chloroflexi bacterium]|nr:carboxypeptidase regulatory-like domain-containing protein [Chloroflexota bacterium]
MNSSILGIRFEIPERTCLWFDGVLLNAGGAGIADVNVYAQKDSGRVWSRTDTAGAFQLPVTETADYYLYSFPDGCRVYYRPDGATGRRSERSLVTTSDDQAVDLTFRLPVDMCTRRIEGQLLNADGLGMSGHYVAATGTSGYGSDRSDDEGVFSFAVPAAGSYRLSVTVDGCQLFYAAVGGVTDSDNARVVQVGSRDVSGIRFHLPDDSAALCSS